MHEEKMDKIRHTVSTKPRDSEVGTIIKDSKFDLGCTSTFSMNTKTEESRIHKPQHVLQRNITKYQANKWIKKRNNNRDNNEETFIKTARNHKLDKGLYGLSKLKNNQKSTGKLKYMTIYKKVEKGLNTGMQNKKKINGGGKSVF